MWWKEEKIGQVVMSLGSKDLLYILDSAIFNCYSNYQICAML